MRSRALWRVRTYVRPYAWQMALMVAAAFVGLFAATLIPLVTKRVIDGPIAAGDRSGILSLALLALALGCTEGFMAFLRRYTQSAVAIGIETQIRNDIYAHLLRLPVSFHDGWQSGQLLSRAMSDINVIRRFIGFGLVFLVVNSATFVVVVGLLLREHALLAIVSAAAILPITFFGHRFELRYRAVSRRLQDEQGDLTTVVEEAATGVRVVKAFGRARLVGAQFRRQAGVVHTSALETVALRARFWAALNMIPNLTLAIVVLGGGLAVSSGSMTLGGLSAFVSLLLMLVWPVESLGEILAMGQEASTAAERIFEVLDTEPEITDLPAAVPLVSCRGAVRFEGAAFAYPGTRRPLLHDVDLAVEPGETVAIVGSTGSGKSTLVHLVPRLHDVTAGRVCLDDADVRDITLSSLRSHVAVAFEEPILFSASVRENLLLGHPGATDDDIDAALDIARAGFARDLPWGLDTRVGEQGLSLSGGQRQRLALARAVIGHPRVLVLDDPLSALDVHTEALVEEALRSVLDRATALVVAHRPSTVALADRVALLEGGTIVAVDTHTRLLRSEPRYRAILSQEADVDEDVA